MRIRNGQLSDVDKLKIIWKERFGDDDSFIEWFFNSRFEPEHCSVAEYDHKIISCLYSFPIKVKVRNNMEKGILVSGVSTLPGYEGKGYMRLIMTYHLNRMKSEGYNISVLKAVKPDIYYSLEHQLINDVQIVYPVDIFSSSGKIMPVDITESMDNLYACFQKFSGKYSGSVLRTRKDFIAKCNEYIQTGGQCLAVFSGDNIVGYSLYFINEEEFSCEECLALSDEVYNDMFAYISSMPYDHKKVRVACDVKSDLIANSEKIFGNSAYSMNISKLLSLTGLNGYAIEIIDNVINENNGIFSLNGDIIKTSPSLRISNGYLTQWIFGYKSVRELIDEGAAVLLKDDGIVEYMDSIGKQMTFIIDEY